VGRPRAAAFAHLKDVILGQLRLAEMQGVLRFIDPSPVKVIICEDGTQRWRSTVTRCDLDFLEGLFSCMWRVSWGTLANMGCCLMVSFSLGCNVPCGV
jgi:hypothetical protein